MLKAAICDDDPRDLSRLLKCLTDWCDQAHAEHQVLCFSDAAALLRDPAVMDQDVIFLDIIMQGLTGMEAAQRLQKAGYAGLFVFTTSSREHVLDSFLVNVLDYLVKPIEYPRFRLTMERLRERLRVSMRCLTVTVSGRETAIPLRDIYFIETGQDHCALVHLAQTVLRTTTLISAIAVSLLPYEDFLRCHRSFIVNLNHVRQVDGPVIHLTNGQTALMAVRSSAALRKRVADAAWQQTIRR